MKRSLLIAKPLKKKTSSSQSVLSKVLLTIILCLTLPSFTWGQSQALSLVKMLQEFQQAEDITPDRFYEDVDTLRAAIHRQSDIASKSIYQATLAHILILNADNANSHKHATESPIDSIREWSYQEYIHHAARLYKESLADIEALHQEPTKKWIPLVKRGRDEKVFGGDMLSVVWQAMVRDIQRERREAEGLPSADSIASFYKHHGLREAALQTQLRCIWETWNPSPKDHLMALRKEYSDLEASAEVYLRLVNNQLNGTQKSIEDCLAWLDEAESKWPKSRWKGNLENVRRNIYAPTLYAKYPQVAYPQDTVKVPLCMKNIKSIRLSVYQLPIDIELEKTFKEQDGDEEKLLKLVRKHGKRIEQNTLKAETEKNEAKEHRDTLRWHTPDCGVYAVVMEATTDASLTEKPQPQVGIVRVSRIGVYNTAMRDGRVRLTTVDSKSGRPMQGVCIELSEKKDDEEGYTSIATLTSDEEGCATIDITNDKNLYIKVSREEDCALGRKWMSYGPFYNAKDNIENHHLIISTDRSIYRPGQKIQLNAVAYTQKGWDAKILAGEEYEIILRDANYKQIYKGKRRTDNMGVLADTIVLPTTGLLGRYTLMAGNSRRTIQVEEYVRPTFRVELNTPQGPTTSKDSVAFEGKVTTYSGVPVTHARITGQARWTSPWWWRNREEEENLPLDTIWTDEEGKFTYKVAIRATEEQLKRGRTLEVSTDALSQQGETQQGNLRIPICSTPLRLRGEVSEHYCKDYPQKWIFNLYSNTDQSIKGSILCTLSREGKQKKTFTMQAGVPAFPSELKEMESGCYDLLAQANINGDTASWQQTIELTSLSDTVLYHKTPLSIYCAKGYFSETESAKMQIGTTLQDAWVRLTMESSDTTALDTLLHLSNSCQTWTIPYKKEYGQGLKINAYLFHEGSLVSNTDILKLKLPDTQLRLHWESFRDHLRPGQQEEWLLSVRQPDGKPAQANFTASLYDASLDALARHTLSIDVQRRHRMPHKMAYQNTSAPRDYTILSMNFTQKMKKEYSREFSVFEIDRFFTSAPMLMETVAMPSRGIRIKGTGKAGTAKFSQVMLKNAAFASPEAALTGSIGGLDQNDRTTEETTLHEDSEEDADATENQADLRTDLQETAFFMPRLRTNEHGEVKICFTLPESMTSWHLLGVAHTEDMMTGSIDTLIVAKKELMAETFLPRFLRNGDQGILNASIRNHSEKSQQGKGVLLVSDTETGKVLIRKTVKFNLDAHKDTTFTFTCTGSMEHPALTVRWMAQGQDYSDGEQRYLPVLTDMQSITETKAFSLNRQGLHNISLDKLFAHNSQDATDRSLTIEYTRDPKWLAIQTLPSMAAPKGKDAFSLASAFYAGALAYNIEQRFPEVARAIQEWNSQDTIALKSPLSKNQELTNIYLQETPWVLEADNERERRHRLATLFDDVAQENYRMNMLNALKNLQNANGSFSWYPGMKGNPYITQSITCLMARLYALTGSEIPMQREMRKQGCKYLLQEMVKTEKENGQKNEPTISTGTLQTLYALCLSNYEDEMNAEQKKAVQRVLNSLKKQAETMDREERALAAVVLHLYGEEKQAKSLMERLYTLINQPDGKHLAYKNSNRVSINKKTSNHVQLMEAIRMIQPNDTATLNDMQEWLISMKHTQEWDDAKQTADAVYILMNNNSAFEKGQDRLTLQTASKTYNFTTPETVLGYVHERISTNEAPRKLIVKKQSTGLSYGAVYAQYQIPSEKAEAQQEGLNIRRDITGIEHLKTGDRVHVRYTLTANRDYEFIRLLAPRPAAAEPSAQHSGYEFTDGLGFYKATHDASTEFFIDQLPQGTHIIEEDWLISRAGSYTLPSAILQCLYAPDFQAHTAGTSLSTYE